MNYEEMSDFEINMAAAVAAGVEISSDSCGSSVGIVRRSMGCLPNYLHVDYCNNPSDAWPIIVANKIWIQPDMVGDGFWHCYDCESEHFSKHKNPLRAAMIAFLKMQEAQRG
ncbi:MAG: phage protein NinX family protein [Aeromonadaceae bacterium]